MAGRVSEPWRDEAQCPADTIGLDEVSTDHVPRLTIETIECQEQIMLLSFSSCCAGVPGTDELSGRASGGVSSGSTGIRLKRWM